MFADLQVQVEVSMNGMDRFRGWCPYRSSKGWLRHEDLAIARSCAITVAITLLLATWLGDGILSLFGISPAAFQAAGGLILVLIGLSMLRSKGLRHAKHQ
jgi:small neutral amino acid transporter SnatA (MarC family)